MNPIEAFYSNSTVLVTGANGFLGSVLVEKLLRCFDVKKIYVLMRTKAGKGVEERAESFKKLAIFDEIRKGDPQLLGKLEPVEADYDYSGLIVKSEVMERILNEVEIIFHVMASVNFHNALNDAIKVNVLGCEKVVNLAKGMKNLKSFVHVSTLFSNCSGYNVDEKIYPSQLSYQKFIEIGMEVADKQNVIDNQACNPEKLPNTYTLTKHFAEKLVSDQTSQLPVGIFRPPIVFPSYKDLPGYTDNINGPAGIFKGIERGLLHCVLVNPDIRSNVAPVDYCTNALIATAWDVHKNIEARKQGCSEVAIYNYITAENNLSWSEVGKKVALGIQPPGRKIWSFSHVLVRSALVFAILNFLLHTIPTLVLDLFAVLSGKKRVYSKTMKKFELLINSLAPFNSHQWTFGNANYNRLIKETEVFRFQRGEHAFDYRTIDWDEFFRNFIPGIDRYFLKKAGPVTNC